MHRIGLRVRSIEQPVKSTGSNPKPIHLTMLDFAIKLISSPDIAANPAHKFNPGNGNKIRNIVLEFEY